MVYDQQGNLIEELDGITGATLAQYIWLDGLLVGYVESNQLYHVHNDHLATPKAITDYAGQIAWKATHDPFGKATVQSSGPTLNIRFPGQYFDEETGLHYNWRRYYDPEIGRYITSDPIGLAGGINTYSYALNNPVSFTDPTGEIVPALVAYAVFEIALSVWDAYDTYQTISSDCATTGEKWAAGGLFAAGIILPGNYGWVDNAAKYKGGAHRYMKLPIGDGLDSHHMPARQSNPSVHPDDGPAIQMDPKDHRETSSNGTKGNSGKAYRKEVADMINAGKMRDAMAKEIHDVRRVSLKMSGSRRKYNHAMRQMLDYAKSQNMLNK